MGSNQTPGRYFGEVVRAAEASPNKHQVVARVNGRDIELRDVQGRKALLEANLVLQGKSPNTVTLKDALELVIEIEAQVAEAKLRGITVTKEEVAAWAKEQRELASQIPPEGREHFDDYLRGRQMTEDEFWAEQENVYYERSLYLMKLRMDSIPHDLPPSEHAVAMKKLTADIRAKAKVEILDPKFK